MIQDPQGLRQHVTGRSPAAGWRAPAFPDIVAHVLKNAAAWLMAAALTLPGRALAALPCPEGGQSEPSEVALSLKNVGLDLRDGGSWAKAARSFRDAADELAECESLDDERLRWSLWAVEAFERSAGSPEEQRAMGEFVEHQLAILDRHPASGSMADLPRLREARDRLRPAAPPESADRPPEGPSPPPASGGRPPRFKAQAAMIGVGGAVLVTSLVTMGAFLVKAKRLTGALDDLYGQFGANDCGLRPADDYPSSDAATCDDLRAQRGDIQDKGRTANAVAIGSMAFAVVGGAVAIAGLAWMLRDRRRDPQSRVLITPTWTGLRLEGRF
jgi:hypothetical protein